MGTKYTKPHLSYPDQLSLLKSRGLLCDDEDRALQLLQSIGYYRLSAYVYPFRKMLPPETQRETPYQHRSDVIRSGATFEQVAALWRFDRKLRLLWLDALETIEVGFRTRIAHTLGARDKSGHLNRATLDAAECSKLLNVDGKKQEAFDVWCAKYDRLRRSAKAEDFIRHNLMKYDGDLPIWIAVEFLDFGALTRLFGLLKIDDKNAIVRDFGVKNGGLVHNWLDTLNYVRNVAAHHSRLWNRRLTKKPRQFPPALVPNALQHAGQSGTGEKVYVALAISAFLVRSFEPESTWPSRLRTDVRKFPTIPAMSPQIDMGFPDGWGDLEIWKPRQSE